jgi:hypothetical protein
MPSTRFRVKLEDGRKQVQSKNMKMAGSRFF